MTVYDKLDWHVDNAVSVGQPPERAFTHIGLYLAWLIRHDLHNPRAFPPEHIEAVKRGEITGSDLADDIDTKLVSPVMNVEGRAFSDARYAVYLAEYAELFKDLPEYGVADEPDNYRRAEQLLDRLYAEWVAEGRPQAWPESTSEGEGQGRGTMTVMVPSGMSAEQVDELSAPWPDTNVVVLPWPTEEQMPHVSPELEALIPRDLTTPPLQVSSVRATEWRSSLLNRALKRIEARPKDAVVVDGIGGEGEQTLVVAIYGVRGAAADRLDSEFRSVIFRPPGSKWQRREIAGREVNWASGRDFSVAYWAGDGMVMHVAGARESVERAIGRLP